MARRLSRRRLLASGALALVGGLAGCNGDSEGATSEATGVTDTDATRVAETTTDEQAEAADAGCRIVDAAGDVEPIPAFADGSVENDVETAVEVRWNARTQPSMTDSRSDFGRHLATRGRAYVVYQLVVTNVTDHTVDFSPYDLFGLRLDLGDATWYAEPTLYTLDAMIENGVELSPGESTAGVVPFEVPRELDRATLIRYVERDDPDGADDAFRAVCDRSLSFDVVTAE